MNIETTEHQNSTETAIGYIPLGNITVIDWFVISKGASFYCIRSGLRHADGIAKSPFYYENCIGGKNAKKRAIESFNTFWTNLTKQNNEQNKKDSNT